MIRVYIRKTAGNILELFYNNYLNTAIAAITIEIIYKYNNNAIYTYVGNSGDGTF